MDSYVTLDGAVLDLSGLSNEERTYLDRCVTAYRERIGWEQFRYLTLTVENPLIQQAGGQITPAVWAHPLYQAVRDLETRLGIEQRFVGPDPGDEAAREPFAEAGVASAQAARG